MESKQDRKARLRKAAGEAIVRAIETGGDPFDLMLEATSEGGNICVPYVQQHPFFSEKRHLFKTAEDRKRDREEAALAAEPGPIVWVRRQFDDHRHAAYRERLALVRHQRRRATPRQPVLSARLRYVRWHDRGRIGA
jgi:uncharacterized protein YecE (DUF72 family)